MKLSSILFLSAFGSALASTIQLPDLADGTYLISIGEDGKPTWEELSINITDATPEAPAARRDIAISSSRLKKRFDWPSNTYPGCPGGDWFLSRDFYDHAYSAFYNACWNNGDHKFPRGSVFTNYQGTSVAYMCAYTANPCRADEFADAVNWAAGNCHGRSGDWMEPGYLHVPAWNKRYGYAKAGSGIC